MNYKTYLFDFDYTLADSSRGIVKCFRIVLTRHQYLTVTDEAIKRTIGKTLEESFSILTGITDPEQLESFRQEYRLEADVHMNVNTRLFPDTLSTLKELKKQLNEEFMEVKRGCNYLYQVSLPDIELSGRISAKGFSRYSCGRRRCKSTETFTGRGTICFGTFGKYTRRNFVYRR